MAQTSTTTQHAQLLDALGIDAAGPVSGTSDGTRWMDGGPTRDITTPIDDTLLATVRDSTVDELDAVVGRAREAFDAWRMVPAQRTL